MQNDLTTVPIDRIENIIRSIRGERVIPDSDLAKLYGVTTTRLNQQIRRNIDRFPADFIFRTEVYAFRVEVATRPYRHESQALRTPNNLTVTESSLKHTTKWLYNTDVVQQPRMSCHKFN